MVIAGLQMEILETVYCVIVDLSFLMSHNPLFFSFCNACDRVCHRELRNFYFSGFQKVF